MERQFDLILRYTPDNHFRSTVSTLTNSGPALTYTMEYDSEEDLNGRLTQIYGPDKSVDSVLATLKKHGQFESIPPLTEEQATLFGWVKQP